MAYDEDLADRVRVALGPVEGTNEIEMFGGLCFTLGGNMAVGVQGSELMVRMDPELGETVVTEPHVRPMDFTGKPMKGFIYVASEGVKTEKKLARWVGIGVDYASSLPPKRPKPKRPKKTA